MKFWKRKIFEGIFLSLISVALTNCGSPSKPPLFSESDRLEIIRIMDDQAKDWSNGNLEKFMGGYWKSDSMQFIGKSGINFGWQSTLDNYRKNFPDTVAMGKLRFEILRINPVSNDAAYLTGRFFLTRTIGDLHGIFTLVLRKVDGNWKIVYDHTAQG